MATETTISAVSAKGSRVGFQEVADREYRDDDVLERPGDTRRLRVQKLQEKTSAIENPSDPTTLLFQGSSGMIGAD